MHPIWVWPPALWMDATSATWQRKRWYRTLGLILVQSYTAASPNMFPRPNMVQELHYITLVLKYLLAHILKVIWKGYYYYDDIYDWAKETDVSVCFLCVTEQQYLSGPDLHETCQLLEGFLDSLSYPFLSSLKVSNGRYLSPLHVALFHLYTLRGADIAYCEQLATSRRSLIMEHLMTWLWSRPWIHWERQMCQTSLTVNTECVGSTSPALQSQGAVTLT